MSAKITILPSTRRDRADGRTEITVALAPRIARRVNRQAADWEMSIADTAEALIERALNTMYHKRRRETPRKPR